WLRRHLLELNVHLRVLTGADFASRHLRLIARRVDVTVRTGVPQPELAGLVAELATAIRLLGAELEDRELAGASRSILADLASRLVPDRIVPSPDVAQSVIVVLLRPLVMDLLVASGMSTEDARALLPPV
ncbi:MAG: FUSC family protein, partial [Salinibacterium sp.]|nr:FUSC family protein [Salinibacterium sp.]